MYFSYFFLNVCVVFVSVVCAVPYPRRPAHPCRLPGVDPEPGTSAAAGGWKAAGWQSLTRESCARHRTLDTHTRTHTHTQAPKN